MTGSDQARLENIVAGLAPADAAWLCELVMPRWRRRAVRLEQRDRFVLQALETYAGWRQTRAAEALATEMVRAAANRHGDGARLRLLRQIIELSNAGKAPGASQIINIMNGRRA